jgi:hypothetical protein
MAKRKQRTPKKGDRVGFAEHKGVFEVVDVHPDTITLRSLKGGPLEAGIPWSMLVFLDEEDTSQAAVRVVRESTENK